MIGGIIITHAGFGEGLKEAAEMIVGCQENFTAVALQEGEGLTDLAEKIQEKIDGMEAKDILLFADMFGATPSNASSVICAQTGYPVLTGVNLPVLLEFLSARDTLDKAELLDDLKHTFLESFHIIEQENILPPEGKAKTNE